MTAPLIALLVACSLRAPVTLPVPLCNCDAPKTATPKEALQPFNVLVGSWKGSGMPEGAKEERVAGAWEETVSWEWKFKDQDAWLAVVFTKGKYFTKGELRYTPDKDAKDAD